MAGNDNEEWSDCEETNVIVEIQGIMEPDFLSKIEKARVLGIDTDNPFLQLEDNTFSGTYQDTLGTCLLFKEIPHEEDDNTEETDDVEDQLEYACKCTKKLCMQRIFIKSGADKKKSEEQARLRGMKGTSEGTKRDDSLASPAGQSECTNITSEQMETDHESLGLGEKSNITSAHVEESKQTPEQVIEANTCSSREHIEKENLSSEPKT